MQQEYHPSPEQEKYKKNAPSSQESHGERKANRDRNKDKTIAKAQRSEENISSDEETIFAEAGHIPDRDQSFAIDQKNIPSGSSPSFEDTWEGILI
ncbi:MAG: hypothetical protein ACOH5I_08735 [Oligoflexus sp.]